MDAVRCVDNRQVASNVLQMYSYALYLRSRNSTSVLAVEDISDKKYI